MLLMLVYGDSETNEHVHKHQHPITILIVKNLLTKRFDFEEMCNMKCDVGTYLFN